MRDYKRALASLEQRFNPEGVQYDPEVYRELAEVSYSDVLRYVRQAMMAVGDDYTRRTKEAGERVKEHLQKDLTNVTYKYQGSVMTNTHIRGRSDIDLVTVCEKFYSWDSSRIRKIVGSTEEISAYQPDQAARLRKETEKQPYRGDTLEDLRQIRLSSENTLRREYLTCDTSKPKAIRITNRNLNRDVEVVTANWYDDVKSVVNNKGIFRGLQIYDKDAHKKCDPDYPFLSIALINHQSKETGGRLKRMIRFMKNVKADSNRRSDLSSFDINAIAFSIPKGVYDSATYVELVGVVLGRLRELDDDEAEADKLLSVDRHEFIFRGKPEKKQGLRLLRFDVEAIAADLAGVTV